MFFYFLNCIKMDIPCLSLGSFIRREQPEETGHSKGAMLLLKACLDPPCCCYSVSYLLCLFRRCGAVVIFSFLKGRLSMYLFIRSLVEHSNKLCCVTERKVYFSFVYISKNVPIHLHVPLSSHLPTYFCLSIYYLSIFYMPLCQPL